MTDWLEQNQVDSLLKTAAASPAVPGSSSEAVAFDFRHPPRIPRDRQVALEAIFQRYALAVQGHFTSRLRNTTDVVVSSVEQATFAEFVFSLASPCAAVVFELTKDGQHQGVIDFGTDFGFFLLDRLFGGMGAEQDEKRAMTPLEQTVTRSVAERLLSLFAEAWQDDIPFEPEYSGFEAKSEELAITGRDDNVVVANLDVRSGEFSGMMTVCIPLHALETFLQEKPSRTSRAQVVPEEERHLTRQAIESKLKSVQIEVHARFPLFQLRAREIAALKAGMVIHTGHHLDIPVEVLVNGRRHFIGSLGQVHRNLGLRITKAVAESERGAQPRTARGKLL